MLLFPISNTIRLRCGMENTDKGNGLGYVMIKNVLQMLERSARERPEKTAFSDERGAVSYGEAVKIARAIGTGLARTGRRAQAAAVVMEKSREVPSAFFGIVYSGNFYIPIDPEMPADRIGKIFSTVHPFAVISDGACREKAEAAAKDAPEPCEVFDFEALAGTEADEALLQAIRDRAIDTDPVYALFTSGSTGIPKGVICCHRSVIDYADWLTETLPIDGSTVFGNQTPFYFSMSVLDLYAAIKSGAELHIIPPKLFAFPAKLLEHMVRAKVNTIYWVPTALCITANTGVLEKVELPPLRTILFAGEAMPNRQLNIWRRALPQAFYANLFGPTEITDIGVYYVVDREFADDEPLPIGKACDNVDAIILRPDGTGPAAEGETGELCIRGSFLSMGYYNNPQKTAEAFIQNPLNPHYPELIYRTGDLVSVNERGEMMYHGRRDFQIKHKGNRIELGEIESAASAVPGIEMCACIYDAQKEKIVLFYQGEGVTAQLIRRTMKEKVPSYMLPNVMTELPVMPRNQNGKIDRKALKAIYAERSGRG